MFRMLLTLLGLVFIVNVSAQDIHSPQALANAITAAIAKGDRASLAKLFSPDTNADSEKFAIQDFMAYEGAAHLSARPIRPDDKDWVGVPLPVLLKKQAEHGYAFPTKPHQYGWCLLWKIRQ